MAERVARQRDHQDIRRAVAERAHALEAEPVLAALTIEHPVGSVLPLLGDVAALRRGNALQHRHLIFLAMDMHPGFGKSGTPPA